jgi:type I restriction enzyme S subunit
MSFAFYKEINFKGTSIGNIPKDWDIIKLGNLVKIETGKRAKGGALEKGNVASIGGEHIDNEGNILWDNMKFIPEDFYDCLKQGKVNLGDILLVKDGATTGKVAIVKNLKYRKAAVNEHVFIIRSKSNRLDNKFLFYYMFSKFGQSQIKTRFHGLIGGIIKSDLETILIPLPSLYEQQKIAEILSTVDEAIQKTNEIIAKTERLKNGLMQELLTKGIGHKEFKDTEIGRIPKEWEDVKLEDACIEITDGSHWSPRQVEKSNYRIATVANLKELYIDINSCKFISQEDYLRLVKEGDVPEEGDVLFSKDGTVGICFTFRQSNYRIGVLSSIAIIKPNRHILFSDFLAYVLKSPNVFWQVTGRKTGTALKRVILDDLKKVKIPIPPLSEQQEIAEILLTVDKRLEIERNEKVKLERIKQGLMNLLLTGEIRVKMS